MAASWHRLEARSEAGGVAVRSFLDAGEYRIYQRLRVNVEVVVPPAGMYTACRSRTVTFPSP